MLAYLKIEEEAGGDVSASHDRIEDLVETCYLSSDASKTQAKKRKLYYSSREPIKQEFLRRVSVADTYEQQGAKLHINPSADEEAILME
jgi:hypothetical protein